MNLVELFLSLWASVASVAEVPARWQNGYVPFSVPWVDSLARDPRIVAIADISFPTMVPVKFNPTVRDPGKTQEVMWVRILDMDAATGIFLGDLMGRPERLLSVSRHDNVLFRFGGMLERLPSALLVGDSYLALGGKKTEFALAFVEGVAANRDVSYGRIRDSLPACYAKFGKALVLADASTHRREIFHAKYLLGRCYSEGYVLDSAIKWYREAMKVDSSDMDAAMSLVSDYTIQYAQALLNRDFAAAVAMKSAIQKLSIRIRAHDGPDRKLGAMLDQVYACEDPARKKRGDPCNTMRYLR